MQEDKGVAGKRKDAGADAVLTFRLPRELHEKLREAAGERSVSEEMRRRLEASFAEKPAGSDDPRFNDLMTTIAYAASAAARMYPAKKVIVSKAVAAGFMQEGAKIDPSRREVEDITAHWLFEACLQMLLDAFRPVGVPGSLPQDYHASRAELYRRADRIVGAALGALGDAGIEAFNRLSGIDQETIAASGPIGRNLAAAAERRLDEEETKR